MKSMTGYGGAKSVQPPYKLSVELKSVNNRYLDASVRLPRSFLFAEDFKIELQKNALAAARGDRPDRGAVRLRV